MSLEGVFFMSLSVGAIVVSLTLIIFIFYFVKMMHQLAFINKKILETAEESLELAEEAKEYIGKVGKSAVNYFIVKLIKSVKIKK